MFSAPGTVSKILWHFTGGPRWLDSLATQSNERKSTLEAYQALCSILGTGCLRTGSYREVIRVQPPEVPFLDPQKIPLDDDWYRMIESAPVCCLADIPIAHLGYHGERYGKIAIGFHRDAAIAHGFNPVFYTLQTTEVVRAILAGITELQFVDTFPNIFTAMEVDRELREAKCEQGHSIKLTRQGITNDIRHGVRRIERSLNRALDQLSD